MRRSIGRQRLANVLHDAGDLVTVEGAALSLGVSRQEAAKTLWRWSQQGWFRHVRRGLYAPIPPDSPLQAQVLPEPWILVPKLFDPGYVGGWSAAEHWDLTEQIFLSVLSPHGERQHAPRAANTGHDLRLKAGQTGQDIRHSARLVWQGEGAGFRRSPDCGGHAGRTTHRGWHPPCLRLPPEPTYRQSRPTSPSSLSMQTV